MDSTVDKVNILKDLSKKLDERDNIRNQEYRRIKTFNNIIVKSNESKSQRELLQNMLDSCIDFVKFDLGGIYLVKGGVANIVVTRFVPDTSIRPLDSIQTNREDLKDLFIFGKPFYLLNYDEIYPFHSGLLGGVKTLLALPILYSNSVKGCVSICSFNKTPVTDEECEILRTLGKHLGHVLHRFEVEQELESKVFELETYSEELQASVTELQDTLDKYEYSQQELNTERENFHNLFNTMSDMVFVITLEGLILSINDAVRQRLNYPNGELIGQPITIVHDKKESKTINQIIKEMKDGDCKECNLTLFSKSNEVIHVDTRVVQGMWNGQHVLFSVSREIEEI